MVFLARFLDEKNGLRSSSVVSLHAYDYAFLATRRAFVVYSSQAYDDILACLTKGDMAHSSKD